ncbi:hypothetical protein D3C84_815120 [compost metagenome]
MSNAFLYRMPAGIPGDVTRASQSTIEPVFLNPSLPFAGFGLFGKIVSEKFVPFGAGDTAGAEYGLLVRSYPITGGSGSDPLFMESMRMQAMGEQGWEAVRDQGIARYREIQTAYPWTESSGTPE